MVQTWFTNKIQVLVKNYKRTIKEQIFHEKGLLNEEIPQSLQIVAEFSQSKYFSTRPHIATRIPWETANDLF